MSNYTSYLLAILALLIIASLIECSDRSMVQESTERLVRASPDSAIVSIDRTPRRIEFSTKLLQKRGALVVDTVIHEDTLHISVDRDSNISIRFLPTPRVVQEWVRYIRRDSLIYQREVVTAIADRPWYESPLLVIAGAILGFLLAVVM